MEVRETGAIRVDFEECAKARTTRVIDLGNPIKRIARQNQTAIRIRFVYTETMKRSNHKSLRRQPTCHYQPKPDDQPGQGKEVFCFHFSSSVASTPYRGKLTEL